MQRNFEAFREWQRHQAQLTKSKSIHVENLFEKQTENGVQFVQQRQPHQKIMSEVGSFGNLQDAASDDEAPQIRAGYPQAKQPVYAKIVWFKDSDVVSHPFESHAGKWAAFFSSKLGPFCDSARYSELRPAKFVPEFE